MLYYQILVGITTCTGSLTAAQAYQGQQESLQDLYT